MILVDSNIMIRTQGGAHQAKQWACAVPSCVGLATLWSPTRLPKASPPRQTRLISYNAAMMRAVSCESSMSTTGPEGAGQPRAATAMADRQCMIRVPGSPAGLVASYVRSRWKQGSVHRRALTICKHRAAVGRDFADEPVRDVELAHFECVRWLVLL